MPTLAEIRAQYPQYNDLSDTDLAGALHSKFYADMPLEQFYSKIGLNGPEMGQPQPSVVGWKIGPYQFSEGPLDALSKTVLQATGGAGDELLALASYARPGAGSWEERRQAAADALNAAAAEDPASARAAGYAGDVGLLATPLPYLSKLKYLSPLGRAAYAALIGSAFGGTSGAINAEPGERGAAALKGIQKGGLLGGGLGVGFETGGKLLGEIASSPSVQAFVQDLASRYTGAAGEAGQIGGGASAPVSKLTMALANMLKSATPQEVGAAQQKLAAEAAAGEPTFMHEVFQQPLQEELLQQAKVIGNRGGGRGIALPAIRERTQGQQQRLEDLFGVNEQTLSQYQMGEALNQKAGELLGAAQEARTAAAKGPYMKASRAVGVIQDPALDALIERSNYIQRAIKQAQQGARTSDLPITHFEVLERAQRNLGDMIQAKVNPFGGSATKTMVGDMSADRSALRAIMDRNDPDKLIQRARDVYAAATKKNALFDKELEPVLENIMRGEYEAMINKILAMPKEKLVKLKSALGDQAPLLEEVLKSKLRDIGATRTGARSTLSDKFFSQKAQEKYGIILGEERASRIVQGIEKEELRRESAQKLFMGSPTMPALETLGQQIGNEGKIASAMKAGLGRPKALVKRFIGWLGEPTPNQELVGQLAEAFFNPQRGAAALGDVYPWLVAREKYLSGLEKIGAASQRGFYSPATGNLVKAILSGGGQ